MSEPPPLNPLSAKSHRVRTGWLHWLFAAPAIVCFVIGLSLMFDGASEQTGGERGIEQSLAIVTLIVATALTVCAIIALLLRPWRCDNCQTKLHRRALSCASCDAEFS
jgi:preprotein translocase subunit SecG